MSIAKYSQRFLQQVVNTLRNAYPYGFAQIVRMYKLKPADLLCDHNRWMAFRKAVHIAQYLGADDKAVHYFLQNHIHDSAKYLERFLTDLPKQKESSENTYRQLEFFE